MYVLEWLPSRSGCYRPLYYSNPENHGTENNLVRPLEPIIFMVSDKAYDSLEPGYDNGMHLFLSCLFLSQQHVYLVKS